MNKIGIMTLFKHYGRAILLTNMCQYLINRASLNIMAIDIYSV